MQKFVQLSTVVVDVSKIAWVTTPERGQITLHFEAGQTLRLNRADATTLLDAIAAMSAKSLLTAVRPNTEP